MKESINELVSQYESGKLTRRGLLGAIAFLTAPNHLQAQTSLFRARSLNHVNIRVEDLSRSEAFYTGVLGLPSVREVVGAGYALDFPGGGFISLCPLSSSTCGVKQNPKKGDIDHFAVGIDNFDADRVEAELKNAGYAQVRNASTSVFVADPDGTMLQLSAAGYEHDL